MPGSVAPQEINPWGSIFAGVAIVIILVICYFVTKYIANKGGSMAGVRSSYIKVIDRFGIAKDKAILLLEVSGKILLVGVTNQGITLISTLDELKEQEIEQRPAGRGGALMSILRGGTRGGAVRANKKNAQNIDDFIQANQGFGQILKDTQMQEAAKKSEEVSNEIDELGEKMKLRGEKLRSKKS